MKKNLMETEKQVDGKFIESNCRVQLFLDKTDEDKIIEFQIVNKDTNEMLIFPIDNLYTFYRLVKTVTKHVEKQQGLYNRYLERHYFGIINTPVNV